MGRGGVTSSPLVGTRRPRRRLGSVEAAIAGRCVAGVDPRARQATARVLWSRVRRGVGFVRGRSRVRRSLGFVRGRPRVKDTGIIRPGRLTRRRSAATATSATAALATSATAAAARRCRASLAVLGRQRLWVEAVGSWGGSSCPRLVAGRYPERPHRRGQRTEQPWFSVPRRSHRPTDEQQGACQRVRPRISCIFAPPPCLDDHGRRTLAHGDRGSS
jgi:hypothetical protein